jgi:hypothetical protein
MHHQSNLDGILIQWGDRLFYPGNRILHNTPPKLSADSSRQRAAVVRARMEAVVRRAPQVMVKVTGGGRGMKAVAAHFRYISKNGSLEVEDERGETQRGKEALHGLIDDWRYGGSFIADVSDRREAFNIMLSMPRGTDPLSVQCAAREFARSELGGHKYVMVLHDHQANPHVHISVRAESKNGRRLNPRKTDLHRWRETFAEKLRERGIDAAATRQATRGVLRSSPELWQRKAGEEGRLHRPGGLYRAASTASGREAREAWENIRAALAMSADANDRRLASSIAQYARELRVGKEGPRLTRAVGSSQTPAQTVGGMVR